LLHQELLQCSSVAEKPLFKIPLNLEYADLLCKIKRISDTTMLKECAHIV